MKTTPELLDELKAIGAKRIACGCCYLDSDAAAVVGSLPEIIAGLTELEAARKVVDAMNFYAEKQYMDWSYDYRSARDGYYYDSDGGAVAKAALAAYKEATK